MILKLEKPFISITELAQTELPDFTVLTGVNGSGKSHLLSAIENQSIRVIGIDKPKIALFNYATFTLDSESPLNSQQLTSAKETAWQFYQHVRKNLNDWRTKLGESYEALKKECQDYNSPFWESSDPSVESYRKYIENLLNNQETRNKPEAQGIYAMAKSLSFPIDDMSHDDFISQYKPFDIKNHLLPSQLGRVFLDYNIKYQVNQFNEFKNEKHGKSNPFLSEDEFIRKHGEKPWNIVNKILEKFNIVKYKVNSPEEEDIFGNFQLKLCHTDKKDVQINFNNLSSGEKVLLALVASVYKTSIDNLFPDVLLLDEVDASLHPSMIKNMIGVIEDVFLRRSVKVILVTHSPTTIALAPEDSIYIMNPSGAERIVKKTRQEALAVLTEGYATLDEGLKLFDEISHENLTIITEGYNTSFLRNALEFNGIKGVNVLDGLEAISGKDQLKTLFDFFTKVQHDNKVLFVWDCDVKYKNLVANNNTYPFIFEKNNENKLAENGLENLFSESLFPSEMVIYKTIREGEKITEEVRKFNSSKKRAFEKYIIERSNPEDFSLFSPFIEKVQQLISEIPTPAALDKEHSDTTET